MFSGWAVSFIAGSQTQSERIESLRKMKSYEIRVFVCTDLISRGIDLEHVNLVVNIDVPKDWQTYMHRVGRAGRFGSKGAAITICGDASEDIENMKKIHKNCNLKKLMYTTMVEDIPGQFIHEDDHQLEKDLMENFAVLNGKNDSEPESFLKKETIAEETPDACGVEVLSNSGNLTIPPELFYEMRDLVNLHNEIFNGPETKLKMNWSKFTYENFSRHYNNFQETGDFASDHDWVIEEKIDFVPLKLRNFFKPVDPKKNGKETGTQTEESGDSKRNESSAHQVASVLGGHPEDLDAEDVASCAQSGPVGIDSRARMHTVYMNSPQRKYIENSLSLFFGQQ